MVAAPAPERSSPPAYALFGFAALALFIAIDFHFDTRQRDAFSWMDPYQYFEFAAGVLEGSAGLREFEVPSIFPFFVVPILAFDTSIPASLWINFIAMLALMGAIFALCREIRSQTPAPLVAVLVLSSPLLIGISRSLYVECTLTALVAWMFWAWLRLLRQPDPHNAIVFGAILVLGTMTKMTFPVFVAPLVAVAVLVRLVEGRFQESLTLLNASVLPLVFVVLIQMTVFPRSFGYYQSFGNTALPIAHLIGPSHGLSFSGATYYFREIIGSLLYLLSPLLLVPAWALWRRRLSLSLEDLDSPHVMLWIGLIAPTVLFIAPSVKEPRHLLPCIIPATFLVVLGIEELRNHRLRRGLLVTALLLASAQYAATTSHFIDAPYFFDGPVHTEAIESALFEASPQAPYNRTPDELRSMHWKYNQSIAISGFSPSESLAFCWWGFPGIVYDLDTMSDPNRLSLEHSQKQFEDLFIFSAFNAYNRRNGWHHYNDTLSSAQAIANADFLIVRADQKESAESQFPDHVHIETIERSRGAIQLLRRGTGSSRSPRKHYRTLYTEAFLSDNRGLPPLERRMIARSLVMTASLQGDRARVRQLIRRFPVLRKADGEDRNIYWIGGYAPLIELADQLLRAPFGQLGQNNQ